MPGLLSPIIMPKENNNKIGVGKNVNVAYYPKLNFFSKGKKINYFQIPSIEATKSIA